MRLDRMELGGAGPPDVLLLAPHADDGSDLLAAYPGVIDALVAPEGLLREYLGLERDAGSGELAAAMGRDLAEAGLCVTVLLPRLPRGIVDPGRLPARALRHVFRPDADAVLLARLVEAHARIVGETIAAVRALDPNRGCFVDLHTMAPRSPARMLSPTEAVEERPCELEAYLETWLEADGERRVIDLITSVGGKVVADPALVGGIGSALDQARLGWRQDHPYASGSHLVAGVLMRERRGITVDVPKDWLARAQFLLDAPVVDEEKVRRMGRILAEGVLRAMSGPVTERPGG